MEYHKLEMVLHSAKGLNDVKNFGTMNPYALMWIAGDGKQSSKYTTKVAIRAGCNPVWNSSTEFTFDPLNNYSFYFDIKHEGSLFDRDIGTVQVSFRDLLARNVIGEKVSYPVKTSSGEVNGEIIISYKFSKLEKSFCASASTPGEKVQENDDSLIRVAIQTVSFVFELLDLPPIEYE